ncbi:DUF6155 family protein [Oceanobacillus bengalensis]|uniref:Uncharacterized protein n=1 Tax=Oceanobacillus bengalensis TaxID=1435466 RepID=A0A494Z2Y7_9BACI|nr:DUF6155 family protein [Oceanobacillus bengalensis]RKQ16797.1 hypothetical protein D8M05_05970 [Oceanobacillus bengalensis]
MTKVTKLKIPELKKWLKENDQKELISIITELYKLNDEVQQYLSVKYIGESTVNDLFDKAKKEIKDEFFPEKGFGKMRLLEAKKSINLFKKLTNDSARTVELMLFYVEIGTLFTSTYGDIDSKFYNSMLSMYNKVVVECEKDEKLFTKLDDRLYTIVVKSDGIGWGYHDGLEELYFSISWLEDEEL